MFDDKFSKDDLLQEAYAVYTKILEEAVRNGRTQDPFLLVALFLGLNLAENIIYQKLIDSGCTIESIEKSKEKIEGMATEIITSVKGKIISSPPDDKV